MVIVECEGAVSDVCSNAVRTVCLACCASGLPDVPRCVVKVRDAREVC